MNGMRRRYIWFTLLTLLALFSAGLTVAQQQPAANPIAAASLGLNRNVPVEAGITVATLPNGIRYYIRQNKQPLNRAELRLVVKAGSVLEEDDQQGLAHFAEHMAFNGTKNFPKSEDIIKFLQGLGMRFGADVNASTGFDETTYMLTVPTDKLDVLDKAFLILEDWAQNVSFEPAEVEKERGVVIEEWRLRRGAGARMTDKMFPLLLEGSRYADRLPIGKTDILQNFKIERLKQFYKDWYRPDLMAVVAVGDFDKAAVEGMIKAHFGPIKKAEKPKERKVYDIPNHGGTIFAILSDKEATTTSVDYDTLLPASEQATIGAYRQHIMDSLFSGMLSARLDEISQKPNSPFLGAFAGRSPFIARTKDDASLSAVVKDGGVQEGLEALIAEARRVEQFGFTATELEREKQNTLRGYERMLTQKETRTSASHAAEHIRNFLTGESLPGMDLEYALHQRFLPAITIKEINALSKEWFGGNKNRMVIVTGPEKPGVTLPTQTQLTALIKSAGSKPLTAYVDSASSGELMSTVPAGGTIVKTTNKEPGITEWELSNGVKVALKPTNLKPDEIIFQAISPGGTSLASDANYIPASTAVNLVAAGGLGKFNLIDLRKALTGKVTSVSPFIGELQEGMSGSSSKRDLETMFQLVYMNFTEPRLDREAFTVQATQARALLANQAVSPDFAFQKTLRDALYNNHIRRRPMTVETVDQWDLDKSFAFYKERFADASDFTFLFIGDFDLATMRPFVEKYLASLPSLKRKEDFKDVGARYAQGAVEKTVEKGIEPKAQVAIMFNGPFEWNQAERINIRAVGSMLSDRLREAIREELGGTYGVSASPSVAKQPRAEYLFSIQFGCDPERVAPLVKRVFEEIEKFKKSPVSAQQIADIKALNLREWETNSKQNGYLLGQLAGKYQLDEDPASLWLLPDFYNKIDAKGLQDAANKYLDTKNRVQVILMPEKK
jgi:zinc protease